MDIIKYIDPLGELERIYYIEPFEKELQSLFKKSITEYKTYQKYLLSCLNVLDKSEEHLKTKPFEHLVVDGYEMYRIKSKSKKKNIRVIYFYTYNDDIYLLCAFEEKNKSDYNNNIQKAKKRIKYINGGMEHEK